MQNGKGGRRSITAMPPKKNPQKRQTKSKRAPGVDPARKEEQQMDEPKSPPPRADSTSPDERVTEVRETAEAVGQLAADAENFRRVVEAFRAQYVEGFQNGLASVGLFERCHLICRW